MDYVISWFEIPTTNLSRAAAFYSHVLKATIEGGEFYGAKMAFLPNLPNAVTGALIEDPNVQPSAHGTTVYFFRPDDFDDTLVRVTEAGGQVIMPKTKIADDVGCIAFFIDSEGNKIGLHTMK